MLILSVTSAIWAGIGSINGITIVDANGKIIGEEWVDIPADSDTWTPISASSNTWTPVLTDSSTWNKQ